MKKRPHKNLETWKQGISFVKEVCRETKSFPKEEIFGITSQLRRTAVSVSVNVAEGAARKSKKEFAQFLYIADGSLGEVDTLLIIALELEMISKTNYNNLMLKLERLSALLGGLINSIEKNT